MRVRAVGISLALLGLATLALADEYTQSELIAIGEGRGIYLRHCGPCHGAHALGNAAGNPVETPDLTRIGVRDGAFSRLHVRNHLVFGDDHASGQWVDGWNMRHWDKVLAAERQKTDVAATLGILKLVRYLEFIQQGPDD